MSTFENSPATPATSTPSPILRIGTRDSELAVWQATHVSNLLRDAGHSTELVYIKSEGDINLQTPLYEMGVQGIFTRALDMALLDNRIDIAVHSMKDVPVVLAKGLQPAAVLERASSKDLLVPRQLQQNILDGIRKGEAVNMGPDTGFMIATSSLRRKAQWLNRYPGSLMDNLRGNVNTRLRKLRESNWDGAIFAAAGLDRIRLRPDDAIELDWMLPAPAQGAILVECRMEDPLTLAACKPLNHDDTERCVKAERDFLRTLMGGCTAPISALAEIRAGKLCFQGQLFSLDGTQKIAVERETELSRSYSIGVDAALEILDNGGDELMKQIRAAIQ